jgi:Tol biopolymer transport system component
LFFGEVKASTPSIFQVSIAGGESTPVPAPLTDTILTDMSADGSSLLIGGPTRPGTFPFWVLPLRGGSARRLGDFEGQEAAWSRDGQSIVFTRDKEIFVARGDGTGARRIVSGNGRAFWPRWSPEDRRIRFSVEEPQSQSWSLWEASPGGTGLHRLLTGWNNPPAECCGTWTPDGRYYLFQALREGKTNIWAIREKVSSFEKVNPEPVQVTAGLMNFSGVVPSKDGKRLFVVGLQQRGELIRFDSKSSQWVSYLQGISALGVTFSPDGRWVAYTGYPDRTLWRSRADGSERLQLTSPPMKAFLPRWSPDGRQIAFRGHLPGMPEQAYLVSAEGGTPHPLPLGEGEKSDPNWSPNGDSIIYSDGMDQGAKCAIHVIDLKTRQISTLPGSQGLFSPCWSPDGRHIAALTVGPLILKLELYDTIGRKWVELFDQQAGYPNWSRDGRSIYFQGDIRGVSVIYRVRVSDHKLEEVASTQGIPLAFFHFSGNWTGLASDDSPLALRDLGGQDVYAVDWQAP